MLFSFDNQKRHDFTEKSTKHRIDAYDSFQNIKVECILASDCVFLLTALICKEKKFEVDLYDYFS